MVRGEGPREEVLRSVVEPQIGKVFRQEIVANDLADYICTSRRRICQCPFRT